MVSRTVRSPSEFSFELLRRCDKAILVLLPARNVDCIFLIDKADDDDEEENGARERASKRDGVREKERLLKIKIYVAKKAINSDVGTL